MILESIKKLGSKVKEKARDHIVILGGPTRGEKYWPPEDMDTEEFYDHGWKDFTEGK